MFYNGKLHTCQGALAYKIEVDAYNLHGENQRVINVYKRHKLLHTTVDDVTNVINFLSPQFQTMLELYSKFNSYRMHKMIVIVNNSCDYTIGNGNS